LHAAFPEHSRRMSWYPRVSWFNWARSFSDNFSRRACPQRLGNRDFPLPDRPSILANMLRSPPSINPSFREEAGRSVFSEGVSKCCLQIIRVRFFSLHGKMWGTSDRVAHKGFSASPCISRNGFGVPPDESSFHHQEKNQGKPPAMRNGHQFMRLMFSEKKSSRATHPGKYTRQIQGQQNKCGRAGKKIFPSIPRFQVILKFFRAKKNMSVQKRARFTTQEFPSKTVIFFSWFRPSRA